MPDDKTASPTRKVGAGALGGATASVGMGLVSVFFPDQYALVPPGMEGGVATISAFALSYLVSDRPIAS